ncbi:MAG: nitroreductase family protein [Deltaproteobacteria bacterium]|nr:nitroreductase family protein [Deltaproteobacteria bacterium]
MSNEIPNPRKTETNVDRLFVDRWSPRSFDSTPIPEEDLKTIFEAARWAPSCFNEQPWTFFYATDGPDREAFNSVLNKFNREWTAGAPLLGFSATRRFFEKNGKPNTAAEHDLGAAWISFTFQARMMGYYTHAMAGFDHDKVYDVLNLSRDKWVVVAAFVIGKRGPKEALNEDLQQSESPNERKPLAEVMHKGPLG